MNIEAFRTQADVDAHRDVWERIAARVKNGEMPPKGMPRPPQAQIDVVTSWIETEFARLDRNQKPDPGRVTARRLNRYEYNNTVRDLLAVNFKPANDFPADDSGYGFDNIGDVLSLSPSLMEKYLAAAEKIARTAIPPDALPKPTLERLKREPGARTLPDEYAQKYTFPAEGDYDIRINITGRRVPLTLTMMLDGKPIQGAYSAPYDPDSARLGEWRVHIGYGEHTIAGVLAGDPTRPQPPPRPVNPKRPDPPPGLNYIEVRGPYNPLPPPPSESYRRVFICGHATGQHKPECARIDLANLARLAYRRPATGAELDHLVRFVNMAQEQGDTFEEGMRVAVAATLVSPNFLFRIERDPDQTNPAAAHRITDFELATRLSYFLWSSMPDEALFRLASEQKLHQPAALAAQVKRMLADPKSNALVENFGGQWLELRNLASVKPDPDRFSIFDDKLRADMRQETELFFHAIMREDRSILDFVDGKFTFLNERLANLYGIEGVKGDEFRRVDLTGNVQRSGVLTQASVLTVSSYPNRTSPVIRGKYILENILNDPPPPPPPNVPSLDESKAGVAASVRQQLEEHRANAVCASCHSRMDPLGFGLENYDAIGRWRTHDGKFPIDSTGTLPSGKSFQTPEQLKQILKSNSLAFTQCLTEKLLTYGLGRGLEKYDKPAVESISRRNAAEGYRFSRLILEIVNSLPFEMRRGETARRMNPDD